VRAAKGRRLDRYGYSTGGVSLIGAILWSGGGRLVTTYYALVLLCSLFPPSGFVAAGPSLHNHGAQSRAGIFQLIENRSGRETCWGVIIQLSRARFRGVVRADQIVIREGSMARPEGNDEVER